MMNYYMKKASIFVVWRIFAVILFKFLLYILLYFYFFFVTDYIIVTLLLLSSTLIIRRKLVWTNGMRNYTLTLLKAMAIANFSKFFLLPIMVWRENTTELGSSIHNLLVLSHHLCALIYVYSVVSRTKTLLATFIILPTYLIKEILKQSVSQQLIVHLW